MSPARRRSGPCDVLGHLDLVIGEGLLAEDNAYAAVGFEAVEW